MNVKELPNNISKETILDIKGVYRLSDVCRYLPFAVHQIRHHAKKVNDQTISGTWFDKELKRYVVNMEVFSQWVKQWRP